MSRQKLTLIVTCTDRKSAQPTHDLMARHLPTGDIATRARQWTASLERGAPRIPLVDLYRGETWSQVKGLLATARDLGHDADVLIASAGLGLQPLHESAPAYAATFSSGHPDSVADSPSAARTWWKSLPRTEHVQGRPALWVLSENYSRAIAADLLETLGPSELLVFGGSKEIPADMRVPADRSLRRALGGTVTSLNVRAATQWLSLSRGKSPFGDRAHRRWSDWSDQARHHEQYDRRPLTDSAVLDYVEMLRGQNAGVSKTAALKSLRAAGLACEQRRFSALFRQAVDG